MYLNYARNDRNKEVRTKIVEKAKAPTEYGEPQDSSINYKCSNTLVVPTLAGFCNLSACTSLFQLIDRHFDG